MNKKTKEKNSEERKMPKAFSFFLGLILLIIAAGLVLMKNGVNLFGKEKTPDQTFVKANVGFCEKINDEVLDYLAYCGDNARENNGHLKYETIISSDKKLNAAENSLIGGLIGFIGLNKVAVTEQYDIVNENGLIYVLRESDKRLVYSKKTLLCDLDYSGLGKKSALKEKTIRKLLLYYEEMFFNELLKDGYEYQPSVFVNIDDITVLEYGYVVDYSQEDICKALETVLDSIANDKKWQKAYAAMQGSDFTEYMNMVKERVLGRDSILNDINSIKGTIYVKSSGELSIVDLTFDVDDEAIEERLTKDASWLIKNAIDVDPVFTLTAGSTVQGEAAGFKFGIVSSEGVVRIDITGHGTVTKSSFFKGSISSFTGTAQVNYKGQTGTLTLKNAQMTNLAKGFRISGTYGLLLDKTYIVMDAYGSNVEQNCEYTVNISDKPYMSGKLNFKDK